MVIYDKDTEKIRAIGEEARQMASHAGSNLEVIWPIHQGVITDYVVMEKMLKFFISKAMGRRAFRKPRISISVPSGITEIERKAIEEATYQSGARKVFLVDEPIAAAIGAGVDITKPFGSLVVDIGAGTTDVAVISVGGVVISSSLKVAGDNFNQAIIHYVREKHSLFIGEDAAENIKIKIGTACEEADPRTMEVKGRNIITELPKVATITSEEIREALKDATGQIVELVHGILEENPSGAGGENDGQRNCAHRRRSDAAWHGYADRAEDRREHPDGAGCHDGGCSGYREIRGSDEQNGMTECGAVAKQAAGG